MARKNTAKQEEAVKSEQDKLLDEIVSLGGTVSAARKAIMTVGVLIVLAALANLYIGLTAELTSPFMLPALLIGVVGNQIYSTRNRNNQKKLNEMKKEYESKFGVIPTPEAAN